MKRYPKKLEVMIDGEWHFVFCRNPLKALPVTTKDYRKALPDSAKDYFEKHFSELHFKSESVMPRKEAHR